MHLPWTQIENEAIELSEQVARLMGLDPLVGPGLVVRLHRWALRRAPDGDFSGVVGDESPGELAATAVGLPAEVGAQFWRALARCGFVAGEGAGGRVRGLERYRRAWSKNRKTDRLTGTRRETGANSAGTRRETGAPDADADAEEDRGSMSSLSRDHARSVANDLPAGEDMNSLGGSTGDKKARVVATEASPRNEVTPARSPEPPGPYNVPQEVAAFLSWAANEVDREAFGSPGPRVRDWARNFFAKYQPADQEGIRAAFLSFVVWASSSGKTPGWGLWIHENVWLERWNAERAKRLR